MFERYTESARRALFYARYEASQHGSPSIETEHLLLGVMRAKGAAAVLSRLPLDGIRDDIARRVTLLPRTSTSVEIPFSVELKRVLQFTAEEADRLGDRHIGTEHLLLALLREETSVAGSILAAHGLGLDEVRTEITRLRKDGQPLDGHHAAAVREHATVELVEPAEHRFDAMNAARHVDTMKDVLDHLDRHFALGREARDLVERVRRDLDTLRTHVTDGPSTK